MKTYHILLASFYLLLTSCATVSYFGDKLAPSASVDIYYSAHDVTKAYKVLGHLTYQNKGEEQVKAKMAAYAKSIGADAIIISGLESTKDSQAVYVNADALKYNN